MISRLQASLLVLFAIPLTAALVLAAPVTTAGKGASVTIDWTRGVVLAGATAPADRHAPSPAVARTGARRAAEEAARARLRQGVMGLPAGGGSVQGAADEAARKRLEQEIARAPVIGFELLTDGSARVELAIGLEAVRQALAGPRALRGDDAGPATWIVDARATKLAPVVGLTIAAGGARWTGPVLYVRDDADLPARPAPTKVKATAARGGVVTVPGQAPPAGALVVVLLPEKP